MLELVLEDGDLGEKLLFDVLGHPGSVAASKAARSARDRRT
jgi:hypothetical protein